ncbi:MAG: DUF4352 domain-containing protein [Ilumatobacteraceae bacterium]
MPEQLPPPGFQPPTPPGVGQPPPGGGPVFAPPMGGGGPGGPGGTGFVPLQSEPPRRPWRKGPVGIAVATAAVAAIVVGVVVVATSGGDSTESDRTDVTVPDRTDAGTTRPPRTTTADTRPGGTSPRFSIPPLTDPPRTSTTAGTGTTITTPSSDAPATTVASPGGSVPIGATITSASEHLAVTLLDLIDDAPAGELFDPDPGNKYVAVRLHVANTGAASTTSLIAYDTQLIDDAGQQFGQAFLGADVGPQLLMATLSGSDVRSGWLTFEVPEASVPQRVQTELGDDLVAWDLTVARQEPSALAQPAPPQTPFGSAAAVIGRLDDDPFELTVDQVIDDANPSFGSADPGSRYLAVQVTFHNVGTAALDEFPEMALHLIDIEGQIWEASFLGTDAGPGFDGEVKLTPGDSRTGFVSFELPQAATPLKLSGSYVSSSGEVLSMALA